MCYYSKDTASCTKTCQDEVCQSCIPDCGSATCESCCAGSECSSDQPCSYCDGNKKCTGTRKCTILYRFTCYSGVCELATGGLPGCTYGILSDDCTDVACECDPNLSKRTKNQQKREN